jgi:hypothetical protein
MAILDESGKALTAADLSGVPQKVAPSAPAAEPGWFEPGSKSEAALRGGINGATLGLGKYIAAPISAAINGDDKKSYWQNIKDFVGGEQGADQAAQEANPGSYLAGNVIGALPSAAVAGGSVLKNAAMGAVSGGATSGTPEGALLGGVVGGAVPALGKGVAALKNGSAFDALGKVVGAPAAAIDTVAGQVANLSKSGAAKGVVQGGKIVGTGTRPGQLASEVAENGLDVLKQPQWASIKDLISKQNPSGLKTAVMGGYKDAGVGAAIGSTVAGPIGTGIGGAVGAMGGVKKALVAREVQKALSPAAKEGTSKISAALNSQGATTGKNAGTFSSIMGFLNQTDPAARAAMNSENPLNDGTD